MQEFAEKVFQFKLPLKKNQLVERIGIVVFTVRDTKKI